MKQFHKPDDEAQHAIISNARSLSPDDKRATIEDNDLVPLTDATLSTLLFQAEVYHTLGTDDTVTARAETTVAIPEGEAAVDYTIRADPESYRVESLRVVARLA